MNIFQLIKILDGYDETNIPSYRDSVQTFYCKMIQLFYKSVPQEVSMETEEKIVGGNI